MDVPGLVVLAFLAPVHMVSLSTGAWQGLAPLSTRTMADCTTLAMPPWVHPAMVPPGLVMVHAARCTGLEVCYGL